MVGWAAADGTGALATERETAGGSTQHAGAGARANQGGDEPESGAWEDGTAAVPVWAWRAGGDCREGGSGLDAGDGRERAGKRGAGSEERGLVPGARAGYAASGRGSGASGGAKRGHGAGGSDDTDCGVGDSEIY